MLEYITKKLQRNRRKGSLWMLLPELIENYRPSHVLDVGANTGQFASKLRKHGYTGPIVSFEPQPEVFTTLHQKCAGDSFWNVEQLALGSQPGSLQLNVTEASDFASFLAPNTYGRTIFKQHSTIRGALDVRVMRLDDYVSQHAPLRDATDLFLKIDTQGFDKHVLEGAQETLQRTAILQVELSFQPIYESMPGHLEMLQYIDDLGFILAGMYPVSRDTTTFALIEADSIFVKKPSE